MRTLNISVICDFRAETEQSNEPTCIPPELAIKKIALSIAPGNRQNLMQQGLSAKKSGGGEQIMHAINESLATEFTPSYRDFMRCIQQLQNQQALLFHCTVGKDRTGFAAAILLACLNVERETIEAEYALTQHYFDPHMQLEGLTQKYAALNLGEMEMKNLIPVFDTRPSYIAAALDKIDQHWGGMDAYIHEGLNINKASLNTLRNEFLDAY